MVSIRLSSSTTSTAAVVAGTTVQLICTAQLSDDVDTPVNFNASWKLPNRLNSTPVFDQSDSVVSSSVFRSVLTLSPVTLQDQGGVVCSVIVMPNSTQEHVIESEVGKGTFDLVVNGMLGEKEYSDCKK